MSRSSNTDGACKSKTINPSIWRANNRTIRESKKVILVESIGDLLSLWEADVKNVIVTFGLDVSVPIINYLLKIDIDEICISFNNDEGNKK